MSKRSTNVENLLAQKQSIEEKIFKLQLQLEGIEKSLERATALAKEDSNHSTEEKN